MIFKDKKFLAEWLGWKYFIHRTTGFIIETPMFKTPKGNIIFNFVPVVKF